MGAKYTTTATAGYNSSPPADDGSQTASNLITWAGIKTKLADVLKTFAESINTKLVSAFDYSARNITSSDNTVAGDHMRCVQIASNVSTAVVVSLGDATTMTNIYRVFIKNNSPLNQTVGRVTGSDTIDGTAGNITLPPSAGALFQTNSAATGYLINSWYGPESDGNPIVVGGTDGTKKVRLEVDGLTAGATRVITPPDRDITLGITLGTTVSATTAAVDFSSIPAAVRRITINFAGVSTNGTSDMIVQLGTASGFETTGYLGTVARCTSAGIVAATMVTSGFNLSDPSIAAGVYSGSVTLNLLDSATNTWTVCGQMSDSTTPEIFPMSGRKALAAAIDKIRLTTAGGTDVFDTGIFNISYEY